MKVLTNNLSVRREQGFAVYVLGNQEAEIAVVPELGAKIISLKSVRSGREWMWHPPGELELFHNSPEDDFSSSPLVGMDECLRPSSPVFGAAAKFPTMAKSGAPDGTWMKTPGKKGFCERRLNWESPRSISNARSSWTKTKCDSVIN